MTGLMAVSSRAGVEGAGLGILLESEKVKRTMAKLRGGEQDIREDVSEVKSGDGVDAEGGAR